MLRAHFEYERADAERRARWDLVAELDEAIEEVEQAITAEGLRGRVAPRHQPDDQDEKKSKRKRSTRRCQVVMAASYSSWGVTGSGAGMRRARVTTTATISWAHAL